MITRSALLPTFSICRGFGPSWRGIIRMLIVGYAFGVRSERALCREVRLNLAHHWLQGGFSIEDKVPDHSAFSSAHHGAIHRAFADAVQGFLARLDTQATVAIPPTPDIRAAQYWSIRAQSDMNSSQPVM